MWDKRHFQSLKLVVGSLCHLPSRRRPSELQPTFHCHLTFITPMLTRDASSGIMSGGIHPPYSRAIAMLRLCDNDVPPVERLQLLHV